MVRRAIVLVLAVLCVGACANPTHGISDRTPVDFPLFQNRRFTITDQAFVLAAAKNSLEEMGYTVSAEGGDAGVLIAWEQVAPETPEAGEWKTTDWNAHQVKETTDAVNAEIARLFYLDPANNPPPKQYSTNKFWNSVLNGLHKPSPPRVAFPGRGDDERAAVLVRPSPPFQTEIRVWFDQVTGRQDSSSQVYERDFEPMLYAVFFHGIETAVAAKVKTP